MTSEIAIETKDLWVSYDGDPVLRGVSFRVPKGSLTIIIGPNGSGKTTLLKTLLGLIAPDKGTISIFGNSPSATRKKVGYVPQNFVFEKSFPMTVFELLRFSCALCKEEKIFEYLSHFKMEKFAKALLGELSGGQLQRVLIVRAMLSDPEILYLDEPVSGVDIEGEESFFALLSDLKKEHNLTILMISHELSLVYNIADQVICLNRAMICAGPPERSLTPEVLKELFGKEVGVYHHRDFTQ